jgi:hypothetical protein
VDSLKRAVLARDRRYNSDRQLDATSRAARSRRICARCWRMVDDDPKRPWTHCRECGWLLDEVLV